MAYTEEELDIIAINSIRNYLNVDLTDKEIKDKYSYAFKPLYNVIQTQANKPSGVSSVTQGSQSVTYNTSDGYITDDIKAILPKPYIRAY